MKAVLTTLCILVAIDITCGCSCMPMSKKKQFCDSDYVIEARVLTRLMDPNQDQDFDDYYDLELISTIKMSNDTDIDMTRVFTGSNSALCGVEDLKPERTYILGGHIWKGRLNIEMCRSVIKPMKSTRKLPKFVNAQCRS